MTTATPEWPATPHPTSRRTEAQPTHMTRPARTLIALSLFNAVSAIGGGIGLVTGTLPVPTSLLKLTPFDTYVVPGLFLAVVIGGSSLIGAISLRSPTPRARSISAASGLVMVGWILGETIIVQGFSWLQGLYLLTGLLVALGSRYLPGTSPRRLRAHYYHHRPMSRGRIHGQQPEPASYRRVLTWSRSQVVDLPPVLSSGGGGLHART